MKRLVVLAAVAVLVPVGAWAVSGAFTDTAGHEHEAAIVAAEAKGMFRGYDDGTFRPDQSLTASQGERVLRRLLDRYTDDDGAFTLTRAEAAAVLMNGVCGFEGDCPEAPGPPAGRVRAHRVDLSDSARFCYAEEGSPAAHRVAMFRPTGADGFWVRWTATLKGVPLDKRSDSSSISSNNRDYHVIQIASNDPVPHAAGDLTLIYEAKAFSNTSSIGEYSGRIVLTECPPLHDEGRNCLDWGAPLGFEPDFAHWEFYLKGEPRSSLWARDASGFFTYNTYYRGFTPPLDLTPSEAPRTVGVFRSNRTERTDEHRLYWIAGDRRGVTAWGACEDGPPTAGG